jgi:hypothetical protein
MGSPRTLRRRRQRIAAKSRPKPRGSGLLTPQWIINDVLKTWADSLKIMEHINKKY